MSARLACTAAATPTRAIPMAVTSRAVPRPCPVPNAVPTDPASGPSARSRGSKTLSASGPARTKAATYPSWETMPIVPHARACCSLGMDERMITSAPALHRASEAKRAKPAAAAHHATGRIGKSVMAAPAPSMPAASRAAGRAFFAMPTTAAPANIPTEAIVSTVPSVLVPTYGRRIGLSRV